MSFVKFVQAKLQDDGLYRRMFTEHFTSFSMANGFKISKLYDRINRGR